MQRPVGNGIGRLEFPAGKVRLHDLEAVCDPVDAGEYGVQVAVGRRRGVEMKNDLRVDLRFGEPADAAGRMLVADVHDRGVVHMRPDRLMHAVDRPHVGVGEADLASDGRGAAAHAGLMHPVREGVCGVEVEVGMARCQRRDLADVVLCRFHLAGEGVEFE